MQRAVDRYFYRSVVDVGRDLEESGAELATLRSEAAIRESVSTRLTAALEPDWLRLGDDPDEEAAVAEPVQFRDERLGWISLGAKRSGAPYAAKDLELVRGIASQMALAVRNLRSLQDLREAQGP